MDFKKDNCPGVGANNKKPEVVAVAASGLKEGERKMVLKEGSEVENIHTHKRCKITSIENVTTNQNTFTRVLVYVLDDGSRWGECQFNNHWREV